MSEYDPQKDGLESYNAAIGALRAKHLQERCPSAPRVVVIGQCELYLGNSLEIMPTLGTVDHVISDPPYEDELHKAMGLIRRKDGREMVKDLGFEGVNANRADIVKAVVELSQVACAQMGRRFIGIEMDPAHFEVSCERIRKAYSQPDMFVSQPASKQAKQEAFL